MRAIIIYGPGDIRMAEVEKPSPGPDDVVVRVVYSGICGTDLAILGGDMGLIRDGSIRYPVRFGHEWSGVVEEAGRDVTAFVPGDGVVSDTGVSCGVCEHCLAGDLMACENARSVGTVNCWDGSFAEYMVFPQRHLHKLPKNVPLEQAALIEPASIALAGVRRADIPAGGTVLVVGTGAIGLAAIPLAKNAGAGRVLLSGRTDFKLEVGKQLGADAVVNTTRQDVADFARGETGGRGVDAVIETSGNIAALNDCLGAAAAGAVIALVGFYEAALDGFDIDRLVSQTMELRGVMGEFGLAKPVIEQMAGGRLDLSPLITHRLRFEDTIDAMKTAGENNARRIKMMVKLSEE